MAGNSVEQNWNRLASEAGELGTTLGNQDGQVKVVIASKFQPLERLRWAYELGLRNFGENYLQEAQRKREQLADLTITWHFIGRIQSNKAKALVGEFDLIHSVGREKIVKSLQSRAAQMNLTQKILLQVNLFEEATKDGFSAQELEDVLSRAAEYPNLKICGLMAFPPLTSSEQVARGQFRQVRELFDKLKGRSGEEFQVLSMGTSGDYRAALLEGSTCLRLGEVLLGQRQGGTE